MFDHGHIVLGTSELVLKGESGRPWNGQFPTRAIRREALGFLAFAIENADEERNNAWYMRETDEGLRLMTGRLLACEVSAVSDASKRHRSYR